MQNFIEKNLMIFIKLKLKFKQIQNNISMDKTQLHVLEGYLIGSKFFKIILVIYQDLLSKNLIHLCI